MAWYDGASGDPAIGPITVNGRNVGRACGYSLHELARVGLTVGEARRRNLPLDPDRHSSIGCNVMQLRLLLSSKRRDG